MYFIYIGSVLIESSHTLLSNGSYLTRLLHSSFLTYLLVSLSLSYDHARALNKTVLVYCIKPEHLLLFSYYFIKLVTIQKQTRIYLYV